MKKPDKMAAFIDRCLMKKDPFEAVESLGSIPNFPKPWNLDELNSLPNIIKTINRVRSFIIQSGGNGLLGLFTDWPSNLKINEIEQSLKVISSKTSLRFIRRLKSALPKEKYPTTVEEASAVEKLILQRTNKTPQLKKIRKCEQTFAEETAQLPEELRQYLILNRDELLQALSLSPKFRPVVIK